MEWLLAYYEIPDALSTITKKSVLSFSWTSLYKEQWIKEIDFKDIVN